MTSSLRILAEDAIKFEQICSLSPSGTHLLYNTNLGTNNYSIVDLKDKKKVYNFTTSNKNRIFEWISDSSFIICLPKGSYNVIIQIDFYKKKSKRISIIPNNLLDSILSFQFLLPQIIPENKHAGLFFIDDKEDLMFFDFIDVSCKKIYSLNALEIKAQYVLSTKGNYLYYTTIEKGVGNLFCLNLSNLALVKLKSTNSITYDSYIFSLNNENIVSYYLFDKVNDTTKIITEFYDLSQRKVVCRINLDKIRYPSLMIDFPNQSSVLLNYFERYDNKGLHFTDNINFNDIIDYFFNSINDKSLNRKYLILDYKNCTIR